MFRREPCGFSGETAPIVGWSPFPVHTKRITSWLIRPLSSHMFQTTLKKTFKGPNRLKWVSKAPLRLLCRVVCRRRCGSGNTTGQEVTSKQVAVAIKNRSHYQSTSAMSTHFRAMSTHFRARSVHKKCHMSTKYNAARGPRSFPSPFLVLPPHPPNTLRCRWFCFDLGTAFAPLSAAGFHLVGITFCPCFSPQVVGGITEKPGKSPQDKQPPNLFHSSNEGKKSCLSGFKLFNFFSMDVLFMHIAQTPLSNFAPASRIFLPALRPILMILKLEKRPPKNVP